MSKGSGLGTKLAAHANNIALHHSVFALPFAYMGAFLAAGGEPPFWTMVWITLAMVGARSTALALDNLIDLKYDKLHPRFTNRPMVTGIVKKGEVLVLIAVSMAAFVYAVWQLPRICLQLLPVAALPFIIYPYTKRFTSCCHGVLGLAIAMAPAGGWTAVRGTVFDLPQLVLCLAVGIWIGAFDVVYGSQDEEFDRANGLHSMATMFTAAGALKIARICHAASIICFLALGQMLSLGACYYLGVGIAAVTLVYQHSIVSATDFHRLTQVYFMRNGIVSVAMFFCTWADLYLKG